MNPYVYKYYLYVYMHTDLYIYIYVGAQAGTLPLSSFQNYVGQDAFFLNAFADAYKR